MLAYGALHGLAFVMADVSGIGRLILRPVHGSRIELEASVRMRWLPARVLASFPTARCQGDGV